MELDLQRLLRICMGVRPSTNPGAMRAIVETPQSDLYLGKSRMDCYHFCQQCEDHFDIAGATEPNRNPQKAISSLGDLRVGDCG